MLQHKASQTASNGFTLVELLVVVSIIALLISILLPSLKGARDQAKATTCAANLRQVGQAMSLYLAENNGVYPPSYVYPDENGGWDMESQDVTHPWGYLHWSHFLYSGGKVGEEAFQCPNFEKGGAPRTNPGLDPDDWGDGQVDQNGQKSPNELKDKQARRMAYATNAAISPRNKFTTELAPGANRVNVLVQEAMIRRAGDTILATEYLDNWKALGINEGNGTLSKSHRPINPFGHLGGANEYVPREDTPGFIYGLRGNARTPQEYGLLPMSAAKGTENILDYTSGIAQINAVGRDHPGGNDKKFGGTANFLFCDTHVERMTPLQSVKQRKWGDRYFALSGKNEIINMDAPQ